MKIQELKHNRALMTVLQGLLLLVILASMLSVCISLLTTGVRADLNALNEKLADLQARDNYRTWHNPITGEEIMETFGLQPCREVGILKQAVKDAIWDSIIPNDHDDAFQFMLKKAEEMGLTPVRK